MAIQDTTKIVGLDEIAQIIETNLNTLSETLNDNLDINSEIVFNITANTQEYNKLTTTTNSDDDVVLYTPGLLERIDLEVIDNPFLSAYNEAYSLTLYGYFEEMEDVRIILDKYTMDEKGQDITLNGWLVKKIVQGTDFAAPIDPDDGSGVDRFMSTTIILYTFIDGGIQASSVDITIDAIPVPFYSFNIGHSKDTITVPYPNSDTMVSYPKSQGISYSMNFPLINNVSIHKIAKEVVEGTWGNEYVITLDDTVVNSTRTMFLSDGKYTIEADGIVIIEATFSISNEVI